MLRLPSLALLVVCSVTAAAFAEVKIERKENAVNVSIDGKEFTTYRADKSQMKPYFFPVLAADGTNIARLLENPEDHPHHKGIWNAIDEVNGVQFWAEKGKIENVSTDVAGGNGKPARLRVVNNWLGAEGKPIVRETADVTFFPNRLIVYDITFAALDSPVTFGDTKEGMFGIRVANSLRGKEGGKIVNAEGKKGEQECWGQESKWVDYHGPIGGKTYGVTLFDDPHNFRRSRFHVRDYGLFTMSPFGRKAYSNGALPEDPLTIEPGKSIRLRYGLYVHDGDTATGKVGDVYEAFLKAGEAGVRN